MVDDITLKLPLCKCGVIWQSTSSALPDGQFKVLVKYVMILSRPLCNSYFKPLFWKAHVEKLMVIASS